MAARAFLAMILASTITMSTAAHAEDGYDLWLRYRPVEPQLRQGYEKHARAILSGKETGTLAAARQELQRALAGMLGHSIGRTDEVADGTIILGTPRSTSLVSSLRPLLDSLGPEGFLIRTAKLNGKAVTIIAANEDIGILYGAFAFLRTIQTRQPLDALDVKDRPDSSIRLLNHWDNLDRTIERGYSGFSLWDWQKLPKWRDPRYIDYARANASVGINGTVLTNVNANAQVLTPLYLEKVAALADTFRPWGIRVYLTARFSAPIEIGHLGTADPLSPAVRAWWRSKTDEIYRYVPDFGGFLVKANSEGQPGPQDYGRTHADGANMFADALAPHGGTVIWRAFVYTSRHGEDRAKQSYEEFRLLDGKFRPNVLLQVKNGPIDFQPREPFHPLFGQMPRTPVVMEAQITKEYLGFATHLAYLGTMWEEVLRSDTCAPKCGTPVARTISGMAGVANIGTDRNWTGSHFNQANWYAFGRLAWDHDISARAVAEEWTRMTWGNDPAIDGSIVGMMMRSRQAVVNYMTPLGLHHLMATGHHYGPGPWVNDLEREDWNPTYFHRADADGIGYDRTARGSNAVAQYAPAVAACFTSLRCISEDDLLWFHHLPWEHHMRSGRTLWDELVGRYDLGVSQVHDMHRTWQSLRGGVDDERFAKVDAFLGIQEDEAKWWRDASVAYFQSVSNRPLPPGVEAPAHDLDYYRSLSFPFVPGH